MASDNKTLAASNKNEPPASGKPVLASPRALWPSLLQPGVWHLHVGLHVGQPARAACLDRAGLNLGLGDMRDQVWWLLIGITLLAVVFYRLLAL